MTSSDVNIIFEDKPVEITLNEDPVEIEMPAGQNGQSLRPRGAWSSSESYGYLDLVSYQGSSYVATKTVPVGTLPTDTGFWMLSAEKGLDGASEWGDITGDIANQTDLAEALAGKANVGDSYTKAETDTLLADKADTDDVYTKTETDALLLDKAPVILNSASGSIASFTDGSASPITALSVGIEPVQSGTGDPSPTNVRPISGWTGCNIQKTGKNLWSNDYFATEENPMTLITDPTDPDYGYYNGRMSAWDKNYDFNDGGNGFFGELNLGVITTSFIAKIRETSSTESIIYRIYYKYSDGTIAYSSNISIGKTPARYGRKSDPTKTCIGVCITSTAGATTANQCIKDVQIEFGDTMTDYEEPTRTTLPISWETEAGAVYGGSLDVTTGLLTVDRKYVSIDNTADWKMYASNKFYADNIFPDDILHDVNVSGYLSNLYLFSGTGNTQSSQLTTDKRFYTSYYYHRIWVYDSQYESLDNFKAVLAQNPLQVVYPLAEPQTIQLTPAQMQTLLGENHIWADTGDVAVEYRADTKLFIEEQIAQSETLTRKMIADIANGDLAPKSLATGDLIIVGDELRKATANIGNGSAITASNSTTATLADVIKALQ